MRSLFYLLVLANLAFAAWAAWFAAPDEPSSARPLTARPLDGAAGATDPDAAPRDVAEPGSAHPDAADPDAADPDAADPGVADPGVTRPDAQPLDVPRPSAGNAVEEQAPAADGAAPLQLARAGRGAPACTMIGPFSDRDVAAAAGERLAAQRLDAGGLAADPPRILEADGDVWLDYWVNLSSLATREQTAAAIETLRAGGFDDAYVIRGEEAGGDIISLGVFREMSRAERLSGQIRALGLTPSIVDRFRPGTVYWLVVEPAAGDAAGAPDLGRTLDALRDRPDGPRLEQRSCPPTD